MEKCFKGKFGVFFTALTTIILILVFDSQLVSAGSHGSAIANDDITVHQCGTINQSGYYAMNQSLNGSAVINGPNGCIEIQSSDVNLDCAGFYIRNTTLETAGIYASALANITVRNCNVTMNDTGSSTGIYFTGIDNSSITNCTVNSNFYGMWISSSSNNSITGNTINSNTRGIYLETGSDNNTLANNTASSNAWDGIYVYKGSDNAIANNTATSNANGYGIWLVSSNNSMVKNNYVSFNSLGGITLSVSSSSNNITDNNATSCIAGLCYGIYLDGDAKNNIINNNNVSYSHYGLYLKSGSNNNTITNNKADSNQDGIYLDSSSDNNIIDNDFSSNTANGMSFDTSSNNSITGNTVNGNADYGISFSSCSNNNLTSNVANLNSNGIRLASGSDFTIANNTANSNTYGIFLTSSSNNNITNNTVDSNQFSIYLSSSSNNTLANNRITNCTDTTYGCIYIASSLNNFISGGMINSSLSNIIYLRLGSNNTFVKDVLMYNAANNNTYLTEASINNTVLINSYTTNKEYIAPGSQLIKKRYITGRTINSVDGNLRGANVYDYNVLGGLEWANVTDSDGWIYSMPTTEYVNNGTAQISYSIHTLNGTKAGFTVGSTTLNVSLFQTWSFSMIDIMPPTVNLTSPSLWTNLSGSTYNVTFTFNVTDESPIANCSVFANGTEYLSSSITGNQVNSIIVTLPSGNYTAHVNCTDDAVNTGNSSTVNFTITKPTVNLTSPSSGSAFSGSSYSVVFTFNVSGSDGIANCSVYANGNGYSNTSAISSTNNISATLGAGSYSAYINCSELFGAVDSSQTTDFTITAPVNNNNNKNGNTGGSFSSGGAVPPQNPEITIAWNNVSPGAAATSAINKSGLDFTQIRIEVRNASASVSVRIAKLGSRPAGIAYNLTGAVYSYFSLTETGLAGILRTGGLNFRVNKTWIAGNRIDKNKVYLYRYTDSGWVRLATNQQNEDAQYVNYYSETPGFSYFAIAEELSALQGAPAGMPDNQSQACNDNGLCEQGETTGNCPADCPPVTGQRVCEEGNARCTGAVLQRCDNGTWKAAQNCEFGCADNSCQESQGSEPLVMQLILVIAVIGLAAAVSAVVIFLRYKKKKGSK